MKLHHLRLSNFQSFGQMWRRLSLSPRPLRDHEPEAYARLMELLTDATNEHEQSRLRNDWLRFLKAVQKKTRLLKLLGGDLDSCWTYTKSFLMEFGKERLISLSADDESLARLKEVLGNMKKRLGEALDVEPDVIKALTLLTDDRAVRIRRSTRARVWNLTP